MKNIYTGMFSRCIQKGLSSEKEGGKVYEENGPIRNETTYDRWVSGMRSAYHPDRISEEYEKHLEVEPKDMFEVSQSFPKFDDTNYALAVDNFLQSNAVTVEAVKNMNNWSSKEKAPKFQTKETSPGFGRTLPHEVMFFIEMQAGGLAENRVPLVLKYDSEYSHCCGEFQITGRAVDKDFLTAIVSGIVKWKRANNIYKGQLTTASGKLMKRLDIGIDDIILNEDAKKEVDSYVRSFFKRKEAFEKNGMQHKRGVILEGPPGTGKCVSPETYIFTDEGMITLGSLVEELPPVDGTTTLERRIVRSETALEKASMFYNGGVKRCLRITTRRGFQITGTYVHPVRSLTDGDLSWKKLKDLVVGDRVALLPGTRVFSKRDAVLPPLPKKNIPKTGVGYGKCAKTWFKPKDVCLSKRMSCKLAEWLGWFIGEGLYNLPNAVGFCNYDHTVTERMQQLTRELFSIDMVEKKTQDNNYVVFSVKLKEWLRLIGADGLAADKKVPDALLQSTEKCQVEFLRALFEAEGSINEDRRSLEYSTASELLCRQVQLMLLNFGVVSTRSFKWATTKRWGRRKYWRLEFYGNDILSFSEALGFMRGSEKQRKLKNLKPALIGWDLSGIPQEFVVKRYHQLRGYMKSSGLTIGKKRLRENKGVFRAMSGTREGQKLVTRPVVERGLCLMDSASELAPYTELLDEIQSGRYWDEVVSIEEVGKQPVVDLVVPDSHSFIGDGVVCHNTLLGKVLASEMEGVTFIWGTAKDLADGMREIFKWTRELTPAVLFLEDIDFFGMSRPISTVESAVDVTHGEEVEDVEKAVGDDHDMGELLAQLDGFDSNDGILVVATTNHVGALDEALKNRPGRFDVKITLSYPDEKSRSSLLKMWTRNLTLKNVDKPGLVAKTDGFTPAQIREIVNRAVLHAVDKGSIDDDGKAVITQSCFDSVLASWR